MLRRLLVLACGRVFAQQDKPALPSVLIIGEAFMLGPI